MQIKATMRFTVTPVRKVIIKEQTNKNKPTKKNISQDLVKWKTFCIVWMYNFAANMSNNMVQMEKNKKRYYAT